MHGQALASRPQLDGHAHAQLDGHSWMGMHMHSFMGMRMHSWMGMHMHSWMAERARACDVPVWAGDSWGEAVRMSTMLMKVYAAAYSADSTTLFTSAFFSFCSVAEPLAMPVAHEMPLVMSKACSVWSG